MATASTAAADSEEATRERIAKYNLALKLKHEAKVAEQEALLVAARKRQALESEKRFERRLQQLEDGRKMLHEELAPALAEDHERRRRRQLGTHTTWMENVFDPIQRAVTKAVDKKSSRAIEKEANASYSKFLVESSKRDLVRDMIDPKQYNPFEKQHAKVKIPTLKDPLKQALIRKEKEDAMIVASAAAEDVWAAEDRDLFGRPSSGSRPATGSSAATAALDQKLFKSTHQVMRDTTARLPVAAWRHSHVLTRMGKNPPPSAYDKEANEAAEEEAERRVHQFEQTRSRLIGDYYKRVDPKAVGDLTKADFPRVGKRQGIKPKDTAKAIFQSLEAALDA